jgi:hypothetical protein
MKYFILTGLSVLNFIASAQQWDWAKGISMPYIDYIKGVQICSEPSGNFYVAGYKWDSNNGYPAGSCIIKYDYAGNEKWRKLLNDKIRVLKIQTDGQGNLLVAGDFIGIIGLNGNLYASQNKTDGFLFSLNSAGNTNWFRQISGPRDENVQDIYLDKQGNLFLTGLFSNKTNINGITLSTVGSGSTYILKFNNNGVLLSLITSQAIDTIGYNCGHRIQADDSGNLYLLGNYNVIKDDTMSLSNYTTYGSSQFIAKFDSIGEILFLRKMIVSGTESFKNFLATNTGLYFTGDGGWTSGGWTKTQKYSLNGKLIWSKGYNGFYYEYSSNNIIENSNGFYTIGYESNPNIPSWNATNSLMISNYDINGIETTTRINCAGWIEGYDIAKTSNNEYLIIGHMPDTITFGNSPLTKNDGNIFIAKFHENNSHINAIDNLYSSKIINIFPNPSTGKFSVETNMPWENTEICIFDLSGKYIYHQEVTRPDDYQIDLSKYSKGVYIIEVANEEKRISKKVVIQ